MMGKADKLLADRSLSALIVACLLISSFAGMLLLTGLTPTKAAEGDLIVTGTYVIENIEQPIDGNVEIMTGGELIVRNGALSIISNNDPALMHSITVFSGGKLTLDHGTVTTYLDQISPWPFLDLLVIGGEVEATGFSEFQFPGNILLTAGATMTIWDTTINALPDEMVSSYVVSAGGSITFDSADDGPTMSLSDSSLEMYDSTITDIPEYPNDGMVASNITLAGSSTLLAVNSYIGVDFGPAATAANWYVHNVMVLSDTSSAHLYGCSFQAYAGTLADRATAIVAGGESYVAQPVAKDAGDTTVGQSVTYLYDSGDGLTYHVAPTQRMWIDSFATGTPGVTVDGASLLVRYRVDAGYDGGNSLMWSTNEGGSWADTGIVPLANQTAFVDASYDLHAAGVTSTTVLAALDISFTSDATTAHVVFDSMAIMITIGPEAYIYRWLNVTVGDEYGVPIPGALVSAVFTGSSTFGGQPSFYFGWDGVSSLPLDEVLTYMGVSPATFGVTGNYGVVTMPFLTDMVSGGQASNSLFVGSYLITGTAGAYSSTASFSFPAYPAMNPSDRSFEFTVAIAGISAPSPDPSRWLVVPVSPTVTELEISNMDYYHAGDVIVAADGTLKFTNAWFQLVQDSSYQRTVYVDSTIDHPAYLIFEKSKMTSSLPINIVVQGYATLKVLNSTFERVNIMALEHATVILINSVVDGTITTAWDSSAEIIVRDSTLLSKPVLSGSSQGSFTNTSVPGVIVENDAVAFIYRWIHVTVLDANSKPLPGALVSTRYYVSGISAFSAYSSTDADSFGVAKVNALGTKITSVGKTFVGNYWVNASYDTYLGMFYAPEVSVGVLPYSEPLGKNATYVTMKIDGVLPDITIPSVPAPVTFNVTYPKVGDSVAVYARITNEGVSYAFNVKVNFYDDMDNTSVIHEYELFATVTVPMIAPGDYVIVQGDWTAVPPLEPNPHRIIVSADPLNTIPEINDALATNYGFMIVKSLPDIYVYAGTDASPQIEANQTFVEIDVSTTLSANIRNIGDDAATSV
ncbi:MAG TPA: CARDB domain-containing protein, partial [Thermoplasmata archaeon]